MRTRARGGELRVWIHSNRDAFAALLTTARLADLVAAHAPALHLKVFATTTRLALVDAWRLGVARDRVEGFPPSFLDRHFVADGDRLLPNPALAQGVLHSRLDPVTDVPPVRLDLAAFDETLEPLEAGTRDRFAANVAFAIRDDGLLCLPGDEADLLPGFVRHSTSSFIATREPRATRGRPTGPDEPGAAAPPMLPHYLRLLERWVPSGLLVDNHGALLHVFGDAPRHLRVAPGVVSNAAVDRLPPELAALFTQCLHAARAGDVTEARGVWVGPDGDLVVEAERIDDATYMVRLEPIAEAVTSGGQHTSVVRLLRERDRLRADLSVRTSDLERTNEELRNTVEELSASNNELVSANERLRVSSVAHVDRIRELDSLLGTLKDVFDATPVAKLYVDAAGRVRVANRPAQDLLGFGGSEVGRLVVELPEGHLGPDLPAALARAASGAAMQPGVTFRSMTGRTLLRGVLPFRPEGERSGGAVVTFVDVTALSDAQARERAMLAEQQELVNRLQEAAHLDSLGKLAGGVAHDFNNILTGVLTSVVLAELDATVSSATRELLAEIHHSAVRAKELAMQMLTYSGRGHVRREGIEPVWLVRDTVTLAHASIPQRVRVNVDSEGQIPDVEGDRGQLRQVLLNMLINAAEAFGDAPGNVRVGIRSTPQAPPPLSTVAVAPRDATIPCVVIDVIDDGPGIEPDLMGRIFEPFFTTKFTGRGLGLAAVQGILRGHGGGLSVASGSWGTHFQIVLAAFHGPRTPIAPRRATSGGSPSLTGGRVLVVDDEIPVRTAIMRILRRHGYEAVLAEDGREAVRLFARDPTQFVAVALDLTMPVMSGIDTFAALRTLSPTVPVLLMSGFSETDASAKFGESAPRVFLQKPFEVEEFMQALETTMRH
jgi:signal transduction histidine kinase